MYAHPSVGASMLSAVYASRIRCGAVGCAASTRCLATSA